MIGWSHLSVRLTIAQLFDDRHSEVQTRPMPQPFVLHFCLLFGIMPAYHSLPTPLTWLGDRGRDHVRRPGPSKLPFKELASTLLHLLAGALNIVIIHALLDFVNIVK
jgi:hypothetical protein